MCWSDPSGSPQRDPHRDHKNHQNIAFEVKKGEEAGSFFFHVQNPVSMFQGNFRKQLQVKNHTGRK